MKLSHDQLLTHIPRREIMNKQLEFRFYVNWYIEELRIARNNYINKHFSDRHNDKDYSQHTKAFDKAIEWYEDEIEMFKEIDNVELESG